MNRNSILKTTYFLCLFFFAIANLGAQSWNTVGNGIPSEAMNTVFGKTSDDTTAVMYAYMYFGPGATTNCKVTSWNGVNWKTTPALKNAWFAHDHYYNMDIVLFNGEIYVAAGYLFHFDGTKWDTVVPLGFSGIANRLEVINGELVIAGTFSANGGIANLMKYDGTSFYAYPSIPWLSGINDILLFNNSLHIVGISAITSTVDSLVLNLNSSNIWQGPANFYQGTGSSASDLHMVEYQNNLYFTNYSYELYKLQNDSIIEVAQAGHLITDALVFEGDLYLSGYNNGLNISKYDGSALAVLPNSLPQIAGLAKLNNELYAISKDRLILNGVVHNRAFRTSSGTGILNGICYLDSNINCIKDANETILKNVVIKLNSGYASSTFQSGFYSMALPPGSYNLDTAFFPSIEKKNISMICPSTIPINIIQGQSITRNFGFKNTTAIDAIVKSTPNLGWRAIYGAGQLVDFKVINAGTTALNAAVLNIAVPPSLTLISSWPLPTSTQGNIISFNQPNLAPYQTNSISLIVRVDTALNNFGDTITWISWLDSIPGDADLSDNIDTLTQIVVGAFDPNDKTASAEYILPSTNRIDYHIRFQNTGTDTAYKVVVVDTLNTSLALTNVVINSASHPYNFSVVNNILVWEFDNIMLPDSGADYLGSQGYVNFSTGINPALGLGDSITNDADIYFDFQKPVITNMAKTTIVNNIAVEEDKTTLQSLNAYPNPAKDKLIIENLLQTQVQATVLNSTGQLIAELKLEPNAKLEFDCSNLPVGLYFLQTSTMRFKLLITH